MKQLNPEWIAAVRDTVDGCPYFQLQTMRLIELGWGTSRVEIDLAEKHLQPFRIVHGGVLSTLVDAASFWAIYTQAEEGVGMTTVDINMNFLAPVEGRGKAIGLGRSIRLGRTIGLTEARIEDESGRLLAHGTTTVMVLPQLKLGPDELPPKFID